MVHSSLEVSRVINYVVGTVLSALGLLPARVGRCGDLWLEITPDILQRWLICQLAAVKYDSFLSELKSHLTVGSDFLSIVQFPAVCSKEKNILASIPKRCSQRMT